MPWGRTTVDCLHWPGAVIAIDHYINGRILSESIQRFQEIMECTFKRRSSLDIPFLSRAFEPTASYLADGLYSAENIESVLKKAVGADKNILDCSYATATGTKVDLPVGTVSRRPLYRVFTNYNNVSFATPSRVETRRHEQYTGADYESAARTFSVFRSSMAESLWGTTFPKSLARDDHCFATIVEPVD